MTAVMPAGVATARDLVGPAMATAITRLSPEVRPVAAYHLGLAGVNGHAPANGRPPLGLRAGLALRPPQRPVLANDWQLFFEFLTSRGALRRPTGH